MSEAEELKNRLIEIRGTIISETIRVEAAIDSIIISHYTGNNKKIKKEFHVDIVSQMGFNAKKELLIKVLKKLDFDKTKTRDIKLDLDKIQSLRNKVAHWNWVSITDEEILLAKSDYIKFVIDKKKLDEFKQAKVRVSVILTNFLFKHYDPFETSSNKC